MTDSLLYTTTKVFEAEDRVTGFRMQKEDCYLVRKPQVQPIDDAIKSRVSKKSMRKIVLLMSSVCFFSAHAQQTKSVEPVTTTSGHQNDVSGERAYSHKQLEQLSQHPQWQHLLFYKDGKAEVISDDFYLSDPKRQSIKFFSPYTELVETLKQANDKTVLCRYPARYLWLSHHLDSFDVDLQQCADLPNPNQSVSLVLVSNYLKNPASSFGHVLVKTGGATANDDMTGQLSSEDLLNNSYNFGARIPENENGLMYAMKGLFGFYNAGFAESDFFKQDAVYSKNEQRDMWEYVLNLEPFEMQLLNYHLHEAKSARFDYYFIKQNCGYRSGEILELISPIKTTSRLGPWYAPDYIFDQLIEHDATAKKPLVASVRYLPSEQTQLRHKFAQLPKSIQEAVNEVIKTEQLQPLSDLNEQQRSLALDYLILHRTYKLSQDHSEHHQAFKNQLLSQRFTLPASTALADLSLPNKPSPALSNKTTQTKVFLSDDSAAVGLSLFVKDPLNSYTDINKRFEAVQATVDYDFDDNEWALSDFVFIDMQQIEDLAQPLAGEPKLSWQLKTGARTDPFSGSHHSPYAKGGVGAGAMFGENMVGYAMLDMAVHDQHKHVDVGVEVGLRAKKEGRAAELSYAQYKREGRDAVATTRLTLRQQLSKNNDARIIVTHVDNEGLIESEGTNAGVAWHHYW